MPVEPILTKEAARAAMEDIKPPLRAREASIEANRCLFCFDAPCIQACPTGIDIPSFIRKIASGNVTGAARTILASNILGGSCARVCPTQVLCEGACVMDDREERPIAIGRLQRYATDQAAQSGARVLPVVAPPTGRKVAVIGAGPAGLGCAAELAVLGHAVTVFEKRPRAGGLNTYGIAYYKMKPEVSLAEVEMVRSLGVDIRCGVEVGADLTGMRLLTEFDAVFLGIGLGEAQPLRVPGETLPEVVDALDFISSIRTRPLQDVPIGRRVAVIGCGNTAIDAATQAVRLGAERVIVVYRRGEEDMSAYPFEYELAKKDGVHFHFRSLPLEVLGEDGHVTGLRTVRAVPGRAGAPVPVPGTESVESVDLILLAIGQERQAALLHTVFPSLKLDSRGVVVRDPLTGATNIPHLHVGGDCANGGREVVNAVGEGIKAARAIHESFTGVPAPVTVQPSRHGAASGPSGSGLLAPIRAHELEAGTGA